MYDIQYGFIRTFENYFFIPAFSEFNAFCLRKTVLSQFYVYFDATYWFSMPLWKLHSFFSEKNHSLNLTLVEKLRKVGPN